MHYAHSQAVETGLMQVDQFIKNRDELMQRVAAAAQKSGRSPDAITVITVTKTHPAELLQMVLDKGMKHIGENRVQEITAKVPLLKGEKVVHCIGHLQRNKARKAVALCDWIHSLDSDRIIDAVARHAADYTKKMPVLVEVNTSGESSKNGCPPQQTIKLCEQIAAAPYLQLRGLMTIGPLGGTQKQVRGAFSQLRMLGEKITPLVSADLQLSMGMSSDFEWAIEEGATMIRVGSVLLGEREVHRG
jgi:pyridoxal phosphate enzyme (YggS family)